MSTNPLDIGQSENVLDPFVTEDSNIFRLASAELGIIEETPSSIFHLNFTLCCGTGELTGSNAQYEVNLKKCLVEIKTEGCDVSYRDAYSYQLPDKEISMAYSGKTEAETTEQSEIGGGGTIRVSWPTRVNIACTGKISRKKLSNELNKLEIKGKQQILLIGFHGTYWTVGHDELGDPRRTNGWLRERYFQEENKPFCTITAKKGAKTAKVTVTVRAKRGHLDVNVLDGETGQPSYKAGSSHVHDWSAALIRARLRGMVVSEALHDRQNDYRQNGLHPLPPSEFELTQNTIETPISEMPPEDKSAASPLADTRPQGPQRAKRTARKT